ncbi:erythromycin biosynthesis sensory transduction protein eryC1, partial [bacterium]|nr:erythromycin biosynthesis sensory transduction protein eryC1 [bacterium]
MTQLGSKVTSYRAIIDGAVARVLDRGFFLNGPERKKFESEFSNYLNVPFCITVANGTDALELALRACGIQQGDRVATVANAGFYTSTALLALKATPFYLDVNTETHLVAFSEIKRAVQSGIKAAVITHLYGKIVPEIEEIAALCKKAGSFGDLGCFSFYPTKNLGAFGDGGAVVCHSGAIAQKLG